MLYCHCPAQSDSPDSLVPMNACAIRVASVTPLPLPETDASNYRPVSQSAPWLLTHADKHQLTQTVVPDS